MRNSSSENSYQKEEGVKIIDNTFIRCKNCHNIIMDYSCLKKHNILIKIEKSAITIKLLKFSEKEKKLFNDIIMEEKKIQCKKCKLKIGNFDLKNLSGVLVHEKIYEENFSFKKEKNPKDIILVKQRDLNTQEKIVTASNMIAYLKKINKNCITELFYEISEEMINIQEKIEKLDKLGY